MDRLHKVDAPTWPPRELSRSQGGQERGGWWRYPPWPTPGELDYTQKIITVALLVLALPWLTKKLLTAPGDVLASAGRRQLGSK